MASRQAVLGMERAAFFYGSARSSPACRFLLDDARTALVGENGVGKSTLLKCLAGELELNAGKLVRSRGPAVGSLPQEVPAGPGGAHRAPGAGAPLARVGADGEDWRIDVLLDEIGIAPDDRRRRFGALSGGWQRLVLIAGGRAPRGARHPDPRRADQPSRPRQHQHARALADRRFKLPMLIVSHDREFLNRVDRAHPVPARRRRARLQDPASARRARSCCAATPPRPRARQAGGEGDPAGSRRPRRATRSGR